MQETPVQFLGWEDPLEKSRLSTPVFLGFPCGSADKESTCNVGDLGSIPELGKSLGEGKGYSLQYPGLENSTDCKVYGVAINWANFTFVFCIQGPSTHLRQRVGPVHWAGPPGLRRPYGSFQNVQWSGRGWEMLLLQRVLSCSSDWCPHDKASTGLGRCGSSFKLTAKFHHIPQDRLGPGNPRVRTGQDTGINRPKAGLSERTGDAHETHKFPYQDLSKEPGSQSLCIPSIPSSPLALSEVVSSTVSLEIWGNIILGIV